MSKWRKFSSVSAYALAFAGAVIISGDRTAAQQVFTGDVVIQGSLCVGFDCASGESFGFDTIRLKENNTRINFMDTSAAGSFPTEDWQLVANQSNSGGLSYFAIRACGATSSGVSECGTRRLTVQAGTVSDAIFVDSTGRVGFRTAAPVLDLHVRTGNTPAQRLEQDGSSGFSPQTWDIAGNEANFFVRDVTGGSRLPFRIRPGAPTSSLDIANTGNVGMGTASPQAPLHISEIGPEIVRIQDTDSAGNASSGFIGFYDSAGTRRGFVGDASGALDVLTINSDAGDVQIRTNSFLTGIYLVQTGNVGIGTTAPTAQLHTVGTVRFAGLPNCAAGIVTDGSGNLACSTSSIRFKTVAGDLAPEVALANIMALKPYVGAYKHTPDEPEHWFIAEEVAEVDPALVGLNEGKPYTVKTQNVVADLVAVIQEQQRRLEVQQQTMKRQQRSMQAQLLRIEALEQAVAR